MDLRNLNAELELLEGVEEEEFRPVHLEVDVVVAGGEDGGDSEGDLKDAEVGNDGCTVWEYKLHRRNIIDGPTSSIKFNSRKDLLKFLHANKDFTGNPFRDENQGVVLCPEGDAEEENLPLFFDLAKQLVQAFGKYVKELEVKFWGMGDPFEVHAFLLSMLRKLPNLKTLHLNLALCRGKFNTSFYKNFETNAKIESASHLEYLNCRLYKSSDIFLLNPIVDAYGTKLKKISVTPFTWNLFTTDQQKMFDNLEEFNMCWYSNQISVVGKDTMYPPFPEGFAPKLGKLRLLYIDCQKLDRPLEWLFYVLQKFPRLTLLNLTGFHLLPNDKVRVKDLPGNATLKTLKFQDHADMNYDFLVKLTGLKNLFIEGNRFEISYETEEDTYEAEEGEIKLRCFLYRKQLSESNVWEKVPSLRKVVLERYVGPWKDTPEDLVEEEYLKPE